VGGGSVKVYIGYDSREPEAYAVAESSLLRHASAPVSVTPLNAQRLAENGLLRRPTDLRGQRYDIPSNAPASTEFAISRFLVPFLAQAGWALFVDSDVVFMNDVAQLFELADPKYAVMVVKHDHQPMNGSKMDGQVQTSYPRKNWTSVMLWNVDHPANKRLSLIDVQERRGFDLHQLYWLNDAEVGELPAEWNWLVGVQPKPTVPKIAHFTLGGPFLPNWQGAEHDEIWFSESVQRFQKAG
jgi:lipopolysaccharide biosynthesis glycosyltransferase